MFFYELTEAFSAYLKHPAEEGNVTRDTAVIGFDGNKLHSDVFADLRRLAAKKALASSKKAFSFLRRFYLLFLSLDLLTRLY